MDCPNCKVLEDRITKAVTLFYESKREEVSADMVKILVPAETSSESPEPEHRVMCRACMGEGQFFPDGEDGSFEDCQDCNGRGYHIETED
jgi:DnaJ-class molecular chaperone